MLLFVCFSLGITLKITYGMLKVMWEIKIVLNPRDIPKARKASIREIPVTISAFSMGMLVIPNTTVALTGFMLWMAMDAAVPMIQAIRADKKAISRVL